jgi:hypothetical protein
MVMYWSKARTIKRAVAGRREPLFAVICIVTLGAAIVFMQDISPVHVQSNGRLAEDLAELGIAPESPKSLVASRAWEIAKPDDDTHLASVKKQGSIWFIEFDRSYQKSIWVELNADELQLECVLDFSKKVQGLVKWRVTSEQATVIARDYIAKLHESEFVECPNRVLSGVVRDTKSWIVKWNHVVDHRPVKNDFVAVTINPMTGQVISFAKRWGIPDSTQYESITREKAVASLVQIFPAVENYSWSTALGLISPTVQSEVGVFYEAWILSSNTSQVHETEYWICASDGSYLGSTAPLSYGSSCSIGIDCFGEPSPRTYGWAEDIGSRMDSNNYDSQVLYDAGITELRFALRDDDVVFFTGHGDFSMIGWGFGNYLVTGFGLFGAVNIPNEVYSKLFFASGCGTGLGGYGLCLPDSAIAKGCGCYCGWTTGVNALEVDPFVNYFFDKVVNGEDFSDCKIYAELKTGTVDSLLALWGDGSLHIQAYDRGPGYSHADQQNDHDAGRFLWSINDEPLWGGDIDAFKHDVEFDGWTIELTVIPSSDMKVKVVVYYWRSRFHNWEWYVQRISSVPGAGVHHTWTDVSQEYLVVISHVDNHGGYYDFELRITAS